MLGFVLCFAAVDAEHSYGHKMIKVISEMSPSAVLIKCVYCY